jgi:hypothetical protein
LLSLFAGCSRSIWQGIEDLSGKLWWELERVAAHRIPFHYAEITVRLEAPPELDELTAEPQRLKS